MSEQLSVTQWIQALHADQSVAAHRLWERYIERLARLARKKLRGASRRVADEDDLAAEVFSDLLQGIRERRFERLNDRNDLWQILTMLTERKAIDHIRRTNAAKRGRGLVGGESAFDQANAPSAAAGGIGQVPDQEPTPAFAAELADLLNQQLRSLDNDLLRAIARDQLAGYQQEEIAQRNGISLPTVQRKLKLIRQHWQRDLTQ